MEKTGRNNISTHIKIAMHNNPEQTMMIDCVVIERDKSQISMQSYDSSVSKSGAPYRKLCWTKPRPRPLVTSPEFAALRLFSASQSRTSRPEPRVYIKLNMKHLIILLLTFASCTSNKTVHSIDHETASRLGLTEVKVVNMTGLDGCGYLLMLNDSTKLDPINLPDSVKRDGLELWVSYKPLNDRAGICMAGKIVQLTAINYPLR